MEVRTELQPNIETPQPLNWIEKLSQRTVTLCREHIYFRRGDFGAVAGIGTASALLGMESSQADVIPAVYMASAVTLTSTMLLIAGLISVGKNNKL